MQGFPPTMAPCPGPAGGEAIDLLEEKGVRLDPAGCFLPQRSEKEGVAGCLDLELREQVHGQAQQRAPRQPVVSVAAGQRLDTAAESQQRWRRSDLLSRIQAVQEGVYQGLPQPPDSHGGRHGDLVAGVEHAEGLIGHQGQ